MLRFIREAQLPEGIRPGSLLIVIVAITTLCAACGKTSGPTDVGSLFAITNCTLVDGTGSAPISHATLVISDGLIADVGSAALTLIPRGAHILDVDGATVLPGFFNAHIHSGFNKRNLEAWAHSGVMTVRDLCGPSSFALRDELSENPLCARLIAAGPMVSVPGGYPLVPWGSSCMLAVTSVEDTRDKVSQLLEAGADVIKLAVESGESFERIIPSLSVEEARAAVNTAHEYGTVASAHVLCAHDLARAIESGVDDMAHMVVDSLPDSLINMMIEDSIIWVPTLELWHHVGSQLGNAAINNLHKFVMNGGMVALGTDYDGYNATFQLGMPIDEMRWMIQAGMSPMQVIVAGTKNAAHVCNLADDLGTLEKGKVADVIVVNGDPLADIRNLSNLRMVIHRGVVIRDDSGH